MLDYKESLIGIDDDLIHIQNYVDTVLPSYHYRFYNEGMIIYITRDKDSLYRVVGNFRPVKNYYTYNSKEVEMYRWRKLWCFCCSSEIFDAKRCFYVYCKKMIGTSMDTMFGFQPVLGF